MKTVTLAAICLTGALAAPGFNMPSFADFDLDGNGKITPTELEQARTRRMTERAEQGRMLRNAGNAPQFADMDTDGNGYVDEAEFKAHQLAHMKQRRQGMGQGPRWAQ